jgi:hypothetical protein
MPEVTSRFAIPYPVASDPAYMFPIIQDTAQEIDDVLSTIQGTIEGLTGRAAWRSVVWAPVLSGVSLGNGVPTSSAFITGDLIVCSYQLAAAAAAPTTAFSGPEPLLLSLPALPAAPANALCAYTAPQLSPANLVFTVSVEPAVSTARINGMSAAAAPVCYQNFPFVASGTGTAWVVGQKLSTVFIYRTSPGAIANPVWSDVIAGTPARPGDPSPVTWGDWVIPSFANWLTLITGSRNP